MNDCEKYQGLMVGLLDEELTTEERREVNEHLGRCARCREAYEQLRETTGKLKAVSFAEPSDAVLRQLWRSPFDRFGRWAGLVLVVGGYLALIGFGVVEFFSDEKEALWPKVSIAAIVLGFFMLLFLVLRERLKTYHKDPYKEIER